MTVKELKEWLNNLPEEHESCIVTMRDLKTMEDEKFSQKDEMVVSAMVDQQLKRLCLFNLESQKVVQLIRDKNKSNEDETPSEQ